MKEKKRQTLTIDLGAEFRLHLEKQAIRECESISQFVKKTLKKATKFKPVS